MAVILDVGGTGVGPPAARRGQHQRPETARDPKGSVVNVGFAEANLHPKHVKARSARQRARALSYLKIG